MKLVHIVGFITKKFVRLRGHMNVKFLVFLVATTVVVSVRVCLLVALLKISY